MPAGAHRNQQKKIDSNNIATVFRKGNAITKLLTDAIQKENAGETGVYLLEEKRGPKPVCPGRGPIPRFSCTGRPHPQYIKKRFPCQQEICETD